MISRKYKTPSGLLNVQDGKVMLDHDGATICHGVVKVVDRRGWGVAYVLSGLVWAYEYEIEPNPSYDGRLFTNPLRVVVEVS